MGASMRERRKGDCNSSVLFRQNKILKYLHQKLKLK
jgi:hypothetical protein